jgi:hypothetical protein
VRLLSLHPPDERWDFLVNRGDCIELMAGDDPAEALAFIMDMDLRTRCDIQMGQFVGEFGRLWVQRDAPAALNWAMRQPSCNTRREILSQMVRTWAELDSTAARAFFNDVPKAQLPNGPLRDSLMRQILRAEEANKGTRNP